MMCYHHLCATMVGYHHLCATMVGYHHLCAAMVVTTPVQREPLKRILYVLCHKNPNYPPNIEQKLQAYRVLN